MVLLHGFGASGFSWRHWKAPLSQRHALHLVDLKGFGKSATERHGSLGPVEQSRCVLEYIRARELRDPILVGHSLGGGVALLSALKLLDSGTPPKGLILVSSTAYRQPMPLFIGLARTPFLGELLFSLLPPRLLMRLALSRITGAGFEATPGQIQGYAAPLRSLRNRFTMIRAAREILPPDLDALTPRYRELDVPALLIWGDRDPVVPVGLGRRLAQELPDARLVELEGCGHLPAEERPQESLAPVLTFLDELDHPEAPDP